jgi:hypothetical protein
VPTIARIRRAMPHGDITEPAEGLPVWVWIIWHDALKPPEQVPAIAVAWTRHEVQVVWESHGFGRQVTWLPAELVWRAHRPAPEITRWPVPPRAGKG